MPQDPSPLAAGEEQFLFSLDLAEFEEDAAEPAPEPASREESAPQGDEGSAPTAPEAAPEADEGRTADPATTSEPASAPAPDPAAGQELEDHSAHLTRAELAASRRTGPEYLLDRARRVFHRALIEERVLALHPRTGVPSNADKDSGTSLRYARAVTDGIGAVPRAERAAGHATSRNFERAVAAYLQSVMRALTPLRPGDWTVRRLGDRVASGEIQDLTEAFEQYEHVQGLREAIQDHADLRAVLGDAAEIVAPDVVVARQPVADEEVNRLARIVDPLGPLATGSPLRSMVQPKPLVHAVVSCKWTLRSDRAQQARAEAQQLIRNRRGRVPHLVMVTAEPMPSRIAAVALGTGDLDCVYHFALHELMDAVDPKADPVGAELLHTMVQGRRLRDVSDLPLDLAV